MKIIKYATRYCVVEKTCKTSYVCTPIIGGRKSIGNWVVSKDEAVPVILYTVQVSRKELKMLRSKGMHRIKHQNIKTWNRIADNPHGIIKFYHKKEYVFCTYYDTRRVTRITNWSKVLEKLEPEKREYMVEIRNVIPV